jgi:prepilin-type processing-associated H-X9-DG protein
MKPSATDRRRLAFTLIEVIIVVAVLITAAMVFLPTIMRPPRGTGSRINCVNNLKQLGLAYKIWELDNGDRLPFHVSVTNGGAMEPAMAGNPALVFEVMSNELSTPKILLCPRDGIRRAATNFLTLRSTNLSYFVGLEATNTAPSAFISGDRNLTNAGGVKGGVLLASTNDPVSWTAALHQNSGNIGLADGSVQQFSTKLLHQAIANSGFPTNRLLMP